MEFKSLTNIETSLKQIRFYAIIFAIVCVVVNSCAVYASHGLTGKQREKVCVLDQGKSLMPALNQDASMNCPVETREHARHFHELFFMIAPDKDAIEKSMGHVFQLCGESVFNYCKDLAGKGYYSRTISGNIDQRIEIDSIRCGSDSYLYEVTTFARQLIIRQSNVTERSLMTSCPL